MGYWGRAARRAWDDTKPWLGLAGLWRNWRYLAMALAIAAGVAAALIAHGTFARAQWYWALLLALAALVPVLLLWNLVRAPDRMDRELHALIRAISVKTGRTAAQHEIDALQSAYAVGRELLRVKASLGAEDLAVRVNDWFASTAALVKRIGSKNEAFTFATATDFASVPAGEKAPAALLLTRLAKLKHIIDRMVARKDGGPRLPGMREDDWE